MHRTTLPLQETCVLTYQVSARALAAARARAELLPSRRALLAVGDPDQPEGSGWMPLPAARLEATTWGVYARRQRDAHGQRMTSKVLLGPFATRSRLEKHLEAFRVGRAGTLVLLATHGYADLSGKGESFLLLAGSNETERLRLADLQRTRLLEGTRLFIASGCVTGVHEFETAPDELGSLAAGALGAGAAGVLATQWTVSDYATFLLSSRCGFLLLEYPECSPAWALREAAHWVRTLTQETLNTWWHEQGHLPSHNRQNQAREATDSLRGLHVRMFGDGERLEVGDVVRMLLPLFSDDEHPFAHPYYWAAMVAYGV